MQSEEENKKLLQTLEEHLQSFQSSYDNFDYNDIWFDDEDDLDFCKLIILHGDVSRCVTCHFLLNARRTVVNSFLSLFNP